MGFLSSRFSFSSTRGQFHSSGMTDGNSVTGGASNQSFEQREEIEKNRRTIAAYRDAGVVHAYRAEAQRPIYAQTRENEMSGAERKRAQAQALHLDTIVDRSVGQAASRVRRLDIVKPVRGASTQALTGTPTSRPSSVSRASFHEPPSRGYDPYS